MGEPLLFRFQKRIEKGSGIETDNKRPIFLGFRDLDFFRNIF